MKLEPAAIANLARAAGFDGRALHVATAIALASSGGLTHYHQTAGLPGTGDWRGLWAVDVDRHPSVAGLDLWEPHTAAQAVYDLTTRLAGFDWSPVFVAGTWVPLEALCAGESSRATYDQPITTSNTIGARARMVDHLLDQCRRQRTMLANAPRGGGRRWPTRTR